MQALKRTSTPDLLSFSDVTALHLGQAVPSLVLLARPTEDNIFT